MNNAWNREESSPEDVRKTRLMVRAYLGMRDCPVNRAELLRVGATGGITQNLMYDTLKYLSEVKDYDDCDVGNWWGYSNGSTALSPGQYLDEEKTAWFRLYPLSPEEKRRSINSLRAFDEL